MLSKHKNMVSSEDWAGGFTLDTKFPSEWALALLQTGHRSHCVTSDEFPEGETGATCPTLGSPIVLTQNMLFFVVC